MHRTIRRHTKQLSLILTVLCAMLMASCAASGPDDALEGSEAEQSGESGDVAPADDLGKRLSNETPEELDEAESGPRDYLYDLEDDGVSEKAACRYQVVWCRNPGGTDFCHNKALCRTTYSCYGDGNACHNAVRRVCGNLGWWDWCASLS